MLTIKQLRDDREAAIRRLAKKGVDAAPVIDKIEELDDRRKAIQHELDESLAQQNQAAKQIGALMGQGRREEAEAKKAEVAALKERSNALNAEFKEVSDALQAAIDALVKVEAPQQADKDALQDLVDQYTGYHSTDYTAETWKPFKAAYDAAWEVLRNENATQAEVDAAYEALKAAGEALVQAPGQSSDGEETTPPAKDEETDTAAAAGAFAPWAAAGMLSALAIGFVWRKKRTEK